MIERTFASHLSVEPDALWRDVTSLSGINTELGPYMRLDSVDGAESLAELQTPPQVSFRSSRTCGWVGC